MNELLKGSPDLDNFFLTVKWRYVRKCWKLFSNLILSPTSRKSAEDFYLWKTFSSAFLRYTEIPLRGKNFLIYYWTAWHSFSELKSFKMRSQVWKQLNFSLLYSTLNQNSKLQVVAARSIDFCSSFHDWEYNRFFKLKLEENLENSFYING